MQIEELHLLERIAGSRMLHDLVWQKRGEIGRLDVALLMKRMRMEALYRVSALIGPMPGILRSSW